MWPVMLMVFLLPMQTERVVDFPDFSGICRRHRVHPAAPPWRLNGASTEVLDPAHVFSRMIEILKPSGSSAVKL
jgi:hypothetical protein